MSRRYHPTIHGDAAHLAAASPDSGTLPASGRISGIEITNVPQPADAPTIRPTARPTSPFLRPGPQPLRFWGAGEGRKKMKEEREEEVWDSTSDGVISRLPSRRGFRGRHGR
ncbi:unnamed protein product [Zymoseptoria tritici ST99CH_1E4]|uniref:Uncharacterized protein n=1 Tax=Zymoseptoria tritici ST99CH_1E4 TaxID=1276532 RepID=A0A2H1H9U5_ZYMTR|nr:unnamed protein product [Zymoseptoria tritici ST99CH_1E4]